MVSIGGDDTASTAKRITDYLSKENIAIANIHVTKTLDYDLPLPERNPTFGFHSAKDQGVRIGNTTYEDARTSQNWFVMSTMGRSAGHLAFGIAISCHFPMMVIPEMFDKTEITFDKVVRLVISSMIKRKIEKINYDEGISGCIVTANSRGEVTPLYLKELQDKDGKIAPRLVEINSEFAKLCFQNMHYLSEIDYEKAKTYLDNPREYYFDRILKGT